MSEFVSTVVVAVITCKRPEGLEKLLSSLLHLQFPHFPTVKLRVVVVENGQKLEAESQVEHFRAQGLEVLYAHEPTPGISYARNCAMKLALEAGDYFAFIDDDEYPEATWLDSLLACARAFDAPVVRGPVLPVFSEDVPEWVVSGGFFSRKRYPSGKVMEYCASNNVLIQCELIQRAGVRFDPRFALTGGEDTLFFLQLKHQTSARVVWCDSAVVYEDVAASRANLNWLKRRAAREGANMPQYDAVLERSPFFRLRWTLQGIAHCALALPMWGAGLFKGKILQVRSAQEMALGLGMIRGSFGHEVNEYEERHR